MDDNRVTGAHACECAASGRSREHAGAANDHERSLRLERVALGAGAVGGVAGRPRIAEGRVEGEVERAAVAVEHMCSTAVTESQPAGTPGVKPVIARALVAARTLSTRARPQSRLGGQVVLFLIPDVSSWTFASKVAVCAAAGSANVSAASAAEMTETGAR